MAQFRQHSGIAAPLMRDNIDTDTIIPSREMKTVAKSGLSDGLFAPWRYLDASQRIQNPNFVLNLGAYKEATILLSAKNFGCGSSREHAVWALKEYGFRCIIAESFGSIFFRNCVGNGILPIVLDKADIKHLSAFVESAPRANVIKIDLEQRRLNAGETQLEFDCDHSDHDMLINGLDPIDITLQMKQQIDDFKARDRSTRPWLYH